MKTYDNRWKKFPAAFVTPPYPVGGFIEKHAGGAEIPKHQVVQMIGQLVRVPTLVGLGKPPVQPSSKVALGCVACDSKLVSFPQVQSLMTVPNDCLLTPTACHCPAFAIAVDFASSLTSAINTRDEPEVCTEQCPRFPPMRIS